MHGYFSAEKFLVLTPSRSQGILKHNIYFTNKVFLKFLFSQILIYATRTNKNGIKEAMMTKNALRLKASRAMSAAFTNELVAKNKKPQEMLTDEEATAVIARMAKQRKDSIEQFKKGNRDDLVKEEQAELSILETYLPKLMDKREVEEIAHAEKKSSALWT